MLVMAQVASNPDPSTLWRKRYESDSARGFLPWACQIVRLQLLAFLKRVRSHGSCVLTEEVLEQIAAEAVSRVDRQPGRGTMLNTINKSTNVAMPEATRLFVSQIAILSIAISAGLCAEDAKPSKLRIADESFATPVGSVPIATASGNGWSSGWRVSRTAGSFVADSSDHEKRSEKRGVAIRGTGQRNNPLRRELANPFRANELFVRFRFRYGKQVIDFRRDVYPLLKSRCFECHAGANPDSGYRLDIHDEFLGHSTGEALVRPAHSDGSRLIEVLESKDENERMPPADTGEPLAKKQVALLRAWIDEGVKWDDKLLPTPKPESDHWAFQPIKRPAVPDSSRRNWIRTPVDAFIAVRQEATGVRPSEAASRRVLIRRLSLDLIGLPPTPEEIDEFLADQSPTAYEDLVERLLASQHYGERWGRYWLDLTRWAESHGYQHDLPRPYAWRYRDYVIDSFNADKPYDRFLLEQIAGDELQPYHDENLIATGFLASARISGNQQDKAMQRNDVLTDIVNTTASAVLGLTLSCAQCHDHKFEPLSQRDHYRFQAFLVKGQLGNLSLQDPDVSNPTDLDRWMPEATFAFYEREAEKLRSRGLFSTTTKPHTWGFYSPATGDASIERMPVVNRDPVPYRPQELEQTRARLLIRGDVHFPGQELSSGWPAILGNTPQTADGRERTALARWMADRQNPLVSRVWVNRIWGHHFGRGIVTTPRDFGKIGQPSTHPQLLHWLACELMEIDRVLARG
jgi:Protein of unknown function (DUF1549)/Protein of unknown function (DUF1553)/Planctomycete cytochrome C